MKQKRLTVRETFIKQLLSLKGLSVEVAMAIVDKYPTPKLLYQEYRGNTDDMNEKLLTSIQVGILKRGINANISKAIFQLFTGKKIAEKKRCLNNKYFLSNCTVHTMHFPDL